MIRTASTVFVQLPVPTTRMFLLREHPRNKYHEQLHTVHPAAAKSGEVVVLSTMLILLKCFLLRQAPGGVAVLVDTRTCTHGSCQAANTAKIDWSTPSCQIQDTQPIWRDENAYSL